MGYVTDDEVDRKVGGLDKRSYWIGWFVGTFVANATFVFARLVLHWF